MKGRPVVVGFVVYDCSRRRRASWKHGRLRLQAQAMILIPTHPCTSPGPRATAHNPQVKPGEAQPELGTNLKLEILVHFARARVALYVLVSIFVFVF